LEDEHKKNSGFRFVFNDRSIVDICLRRIKTISNQRYQMEGGDNDDFDEFFSIEINGSPRSTAAAITAIRLIHSQRLPINGHWSITDA